MYNMYNLFATFVTLLTLMTASQTEAMGYGGYGGYGRYSNQPPAVYVPDINPSIYSYIFNHNPPPSALYRGLPAPYMMIYDKYYVHRKANPPPTSFYGYGGYGVYGNYGP